ncbi:solute carrier family 23 protein [Sporomusa sp. KB1]|uniref:solute carrier family 23 protein n=1 Tax=Sporomusa sp. KB1 TaxID=943346 RepID=UPI001C941205|nr:solute carrier family 23 protein [Sporomusa sp. KB1]
MNDANWIRPDMNTIGGGLLAEGLGTMISGLCGTMGQTTSSSSMGLSIATGALSRF